MREFLPLLLLLALAGGASATIGPISLNCSDALEQWAQCDLCSGGTFNGSQPIIATPDVQAIIDLANAQALEIVALQANNTALQANITALQAQVAALQANESTTLGQLAACQASLTDCSNADSQCNGNLTICNANYAAALVTIANDNAIIAAFNGSNTTQTLIYQLGNCTQGWAGTNASFAQCQLILNNCDNQIEGNATSLALCLGNLTQANTNVANLNNYLATCNNLLAGNNTALILCDSDLALCEQELSSNSTADLLCLGNLTQCNTNVANLNNYLATCNALFAGNITILQNTQTALLLCQQELGTNVTADELCIGNLTQCNNNVGNLNNYLSTCNALLTGNNTALLLCQAELGSNSTADNLCLGNLTQANTNIGNLNNYLATCNTLLSGNNTALLLCQAELGTNSTADVLCLGNLTQANNNVANLNNYLATCNNLLLGNNTALLLCQAELGSNSTADQICLGNLTQCNANLANEILLAGQQVEEYLLQQLYTAPTAALGLRLLNFYHYGPLVRLQLANGTQQDFYPLNGILNTTAILAFAGTGTAYVTILYDQSGNGNHFYQDTLGLMPFVATNGYMVLQGGRPAMLFNTTASVNTTIPSWYPSAPSSNVFMQCSLIGPYVPTVAASVVTNVFANASTPAGILGLYGWNLGLELYNGTSLAVNTAGSSATASLWVDTLTTSTVSLPTTPSLAYSPGTLVSAYWTTSYTFNLDTIGGYYSQSGSNVLLGTVGEVLLWGQQPTTADQNAVYGSQQGYYNLAIGVTSQLSVAPSIALSIRLLSSTYAGPCMQVRRSSDNALQNIGFNSTGELDVPSLLNFVGGGNNGFVQIWYDQSGNGHNAGQTNSSSQPQIVTSGALNTVNGRASVLFTGSSTTYLWISNYANLGTVVYGSMVFDMTSTSTTARLVSMGTSGDTGAGGFEMFLQQTGGLAGEQNGVFTEVSAPIGRLQTAISGLSGTNQVLYFDGGLVQTVANSPTLSINRVAIGCEAENAVANCFTGYVDEFIAWNASPATADIGTIQLSQSEYFKVGPLPLSESLNTWSGGSVTTGLGTNFVAYSVRLVVNAYLGPCMTVRRSSDGATQNISFSAQGNLDVVSLLAFVGNGNNGTVTTWFDQGPLSANAIQPSTDRQPFIVLNGVLLTSYSGRPAPTFYAASGAAYMYVTGFTDTTTNLYGVAVAAATSNIPDFARLISCSTGYSYPDHEGTCCASLIQYNAASPPGSITTNRDGDDSSVPSWPFANNILHSVSSSIAGAVVQIQVDGTYFTPSATVNASFDVTFIAIGTGTDMGSGFTWDGPIQEVIVGSTVPTLAVEAVILASQQAYFGTYNASVSVSNTNVQPASCPANLATLVSELSTCNTLFSANYSLYLACQNNQTALTNLTSQLLQEPLLTQVYTPPAFAGSVARALSPTWTGPLVRLYLSSSIQQDFYPTPFEGLLNITAVLAWAGSSTVYVTILYDQSGNGNHFYQSTQSLMPILATNGYLIQQGGRPAMLFNTTSTVAMNIPSYDPVHPSSAVAMQCSLYGPNIYTVMGIMVVNVFANTTAPAGIVGFYGWNLGLQIPSGGNYIQYATDIDEGYYNIWANTATTYGSPSTSAPQLPYSYGQLISLAWEGSNSNLVDTIGGYFSQSGAQVLIGTVSEVLLWSEVPSTVDQNAIYGNQQEFYNLGHGILTQIQSASPYLAFGVRQLVARYSGPCMAVRRSSDNTIKNIGFNATGDLDVVSLQAFVGTGNGFVQTWFDQSGYGSNALQTNNTNQPQIVTSGILNTYNGRPSIVYSSGSTTYLLITGYSNVGQTIYTNLVYESTSGSTGTILSMGTLTAGSDTGSGGILVFSVTTQLQVYNGGNFEAIQPLNRLQYATIISDGNDFKVGLESNFLSVSTHTSAFAISDVAIGARLGSAISAPFVSGNINELIIYNQVPSASDQQLLAASEAAYFQIGPLPLSESLDTVSNYVETPGLGTNYIALSVRLVVNAYTGACMHVRRSSDNTAQDIGFTYEGNLDIVALQNFVGAGNNGYIVTWYDQGPLGANAGQSTNSLQPQIVSNGLVITSYNGRPAPTFTDASNTNLDITVSGFTTTAILMNAVAASTSNIGTPEGYIFSCSATGQNPLTSNSYIGYSVGSGVIETNRNGNTVSHNWAVNTLHSTTAVVNGGTTTVSVDGATSSSSISSNSFAVTYIQIGTLNVFAGFAWDGVIQEVFIGSTASTTAAQSQILASQQTYFATYLAPIAINNTNPIEPSGQGFQIAQVPLLQQLYTAPTFAGSVARQLNSQWNGPLVRLQIATGVEQDFYPVNGVLNQQAVLNFAGSYTAYVVILYDQSGGSNHFTQELQSIAPFLATNGYIILQGGQPAMMWNSSTTVTSQNVPSWYSSDVSTNVPLFTSLAGPYIPTVAISVVTNVFANATGVCGGIVGRLGWDEGIRAGTCSGNVLQFTPNSAESASASICTNNGVFTTSTGAPTTPYTYGTPVSVYATVQDPMIINTIGSYAGNVATTRFMYGTIQEVILWSQQPPASDQNAVYASQQEFYRLATGVVSQLSTAPAIALGVRLLSSTYPVTSPCMTVRRSIDNIMTNIGFNSTGDLDVASLMTFVGSGTGYVTVLYDQSGNGNNAVQTNTTNQPTIVTSGVLNTWNGRPAIIFSNNPTYLFINTYVNNGLTIAVSAVFAFTTNSGGGRLIATGNAFSCCQYLPFFQNAGPSYGYALQTYNGPAGNIYASAEFPVNRLQSAISSYDGVNLRLYLDGSLLQVSPAGSSDLGIQYVTLGAALATPISGGTYGPLSETIIWTTIPSAWDLQLIQASQAEYYRIGSVPVTDQLLLGNSGGSFATTGLGSNFVAYSVRLVVNTYTSYCMQVRRSNDSVTANIGFTTQGDLDVVALQTFVGPGNNGYMAIWYDQGPLSANAVQSTAANQPQIVANGLVITSYNGRPAPTFIGSVNTYLIIAGFSDSTTGIFLTGVVLTTSNANLADEVRILSASVNSATFDSASTTAIGFGVGSGPIITSIYDDASRGSATIALNALNSLSAYVSGGTPLQLSVNGQQIAPVTIPSASFAITYMLLGQAVNFVTEIPSFDGIMQEVFVGSTVPTALAQNQILQSQQAYFGTYNAPISAQFSAAQTYCYAMRLVSNGYTGPLLTVQRSSDSTNLAIYPDPRTGWLNVTAIQNFVGSGTGYITEWYDQCGNAPVTQATQANMPVIVAAGVLVTQNGMPCAHFPGSVNNYLSSGTVAASASQLWWFSAVVNVGTVAASDLVTVASLGPVGSPTWQFYVQQGSPYNVLCSDTSCSSNLATTYTQGTLQINQCQISSTTVKILINVATTASASQTCTAHTETVVSLGYSSPTFFAGYVCEAIFGPSLPATATYNAVSYSQSFAFGVTT